MHSAYTRQNPPSYEPPAGVEETIGWQLAAQTWREHLPDDLLGLECETCHRTWPCDAWEIAEDLLNGSRAYAAHDGPDGPEQEDDLLPITPVFTTSTPAIPRHRAG
ncbi:hypothetical protein [Stackebrandtia albiflava]|nr:hypothetical protein [Stackebrandtia albiflava]